MCVPTNLRLILLINNASNIHFNTQVLTHTLLLDEIHGLSPLYVGLIHKVVWPTCMSVKINKY